MTTSVKSSEKKPERLLKVKRQPKPTIGWREFASLPLLGIDNIKVKVDTGARSSALHAWHIEPFERDGADWVRFELHPLQRNNRIVIKCEAPVFDIRSVKNTSGRSEKRYVIQSQIMLGETSWPIAITLTNRDEMGFRMLLGRTAIRKRYLVDPGRSYLIS